MTKTATTTFTGNYGEIDVDASDLVVASICKHVCERYARKLDEARNSSYRVAMRIMTEELGMCEDFARGVYSELFGEARPTVN